MKLVIMTKAKKLAEGTIRMHGGKKVQKKAGKWLPYSEKKERAKDRELARKEYLARQRKEGIVEEEAPLSEAIRNRAVKLSDKIMRSERYRSSETKEEITLDVADIADQVVDKILSTQKGYSDEQENRLAEVVFEHVDKVYPQYKKKKEAAPSLESKFPKSFNVSTDSYESAETLIADRFRKAGAKVKETEEGDFVIGIGGKKATMYSYDMDLDEMDDELSKIGYGVRTDPDDEEVFLVERKGK